MTKAKILNFVRTATNFRKPNGYISFTILMALAYCLLNYFLYPKPVFIDFITTSLKEGKTVSLVLNENTTYSREYFATIDKTIYKWVVYLRDTEDVAKALEPYKIELPKHPISPVERMVFTRFLDSFLYFIYFMFAVCAYKTFVHVKAETKNLVLEKPKTKFKDVAGIEHILSEVREAVAHFKNSEKLTKLGGKAMKGLMFYGPPGTGKTLMAKAIAGEMDCSFIAATGSQFVELYVGMGAKRVREIFAAARANAPCILFIDEIDAVAIKRGSNKSHSEYEQTVNEMLAQMDGFKDNSQILVIAATNNLDTLDEALLRPGRFDRKIKVDLPSVEGRKEILSLYIDANKQMKDIDIPALAKQTTGFSGADIKNLVDMAIYEAVKADSEFILMPHFWEAKNKVQLGAVSNIKLNDTEKLSTAYHEIGHALVAKLVEGMKVEHISIMPRGMSLGQTYFTKEEKYSWSKEDLIKQIQVLLGGRVAERLITNTESTGASHDLKTATNLARSLVCQFGMSSMGPVNMEFGSAEYMSLSEATKKQLDDETFKILRDMDQQVFSLLEKNKALVKMWAEKLVEKEQIEATEFYAS